jgi:hypothetical protein
LQNSKRLFNHLGFKFIILIVFLAAFFIRLEGVQHFFTHFDDIGVVHMLEPYFKGEENINSLATYNQAVRGISASLTYAPLQYFFTVPLIDREDSYHDLLFWGRLPSFIFSIIGLIILAIILSRILSQKQQMLIFLPLIFFAFSWQNIIYSAHMSNYILSLTLMTITLFYLQFRPHIFDTKIFIKDSVILTLLIWGSYQFIFFIPAFLFTLYKITKNRNYLKYYLGLITITVINYIILYFYSLSEHIHNSLSYSWNVGLNNQFLFQWPDSFLGSIIYPFRFFIQNTYKILLNHLSMLPEGHILNYINFAIIIILMGLGFKRLHHTSRSFFILFTSYTITILLLVMAGKLAYSPTRHTMLFTPMAVILMSYGLKYINKQMIIRGIGIWSMILFISFIKFSENELLARFNLIQEDYFVEIVDKYQVDTIFYADCSPQLFYMKKLKSFNITFIKTNCGELTPLDKKTKLTEKNSVFLYAGHVVNLTDQKVQEYGSKQLQNKDLNILFKKSISTLRQVGLSSEIDNYGNSLYVTVFK